MLTARARLAVCGGALDEVIGWLPAFEKAGGDMLMTPDLPDRDAQVCRSSAISQQRYRKHMFFAT
jgi:2-methylisocitrate lyase-like PEP mutase family enzyme